jgi:hypothetical protein
MLRGHKKYVFVPSMDATDIIGLWPSIRSFARDTGLDYGHARMIKVRNRIPLKRWPTVLKAARRRGISLTMEQLAAANSRPAA